MEFIVGPLLWRDGKYCYDVFTAAEGRRTSFRYDKLDQARYDRRALLAEARADRRNIVDDCDTQAEFERRVAEARDGADQPAH